MLGKYSKISLSPFAAPVKAARDRELVSLTDGARSSMSIISPPDETNFTIEPQPSGFTYDDLAKLNNKSTSCLLKLAVMGHVDLNAFFAQVEQVRLNLSIDDPVVCVQ